MKISKDEEILQAILTGQNSDVLHYLYKQALPKITAFIRQNNGDEDEAKDIFQDAVIALFNTVKLKKYDSSKSVEGFLFFVSRNLWINRIKKRNKQVHGLELGEKEADDNIEAVLISKEKQRAIDQLMEKIGNPCKQLLKLSMYENLSMREIAVRMGLSGENVAKTTHYRCKQKMLLLVRENRSIFQLLKG